MSLVSDKSLCGFKIKKCKKCPFLGKIWKISALFRIKWLACSDQNFKILDIFWATALFWFLRILSEISHKCLFFIKFRILSETLEFASHSMVLKDTCHIWIDFSNGKLVKHLPQNKIGWFFFWVESFLGPTYLTQILSPGKCNFAMNKKVEYEIHLLNPFRSKLTE